MDSERAGLGRRTVLQGAAAALALPALSKAAGPPGCPSETPALVVLYLNGGPAGLFNSAGSFVAQRAFGVTRDNVRPVGNGLVVDAATLGTLPPAALGHMAAINFRHGLYTHDLSRAALLQTGSRSNLLLLSGAMTSPAPIRCAVVNNLGLPAGVDRSPPAENGVVLERVLSLQTIPVLTDPAQASLDLGQLMVAYGVDPWVTSISDAKTTLLAAELLVRGGTSVVFAQPAFVGRPDRQFDTHSDAEGVKARDIMSSIIGEVRTFVARAQEIPGRNVVVALMGEFSRTVGESDHAPGGTTTVIGRHVKTGSAGPQTAGGLPPPTSPPPAGLWAYLATVLQLKEHPFGVNPHPELVV
ncbi:MAG TPA: hypothetical protein VFN45_07960 [Myxococcaceae bacterium]|nr:hypothetical protein [Myxococcaceae bacterium]